MDDHYCLYALTWADCPEDSFGSGVDPRFPVELVRYGRLAAVTSRVGLDRFDLAKLQEGTADLPWLSTVAIRHNEIIVAAARHLPVLPMRLGIFFASRSSLIAKLGPYEADTAEFLRRIEDRQEWAVKVYCAEHSAREFDGPVQAGGGTQYLAAKGLLVQRRRQAQAAVRQAVSTLEARLQGVTDEFHRLRPLPTALTNRTEKMVWNGAFLLRKSSLGSFHAACEQLANELAPQGLLVEPTVPWPPYHFCPCFEPQDENSPCPCTC
jgi:hypothetical protein